MKFLLVLALVATATALAPFYDAGKDGTKGRYIVVLRDGVNLDVTVDRFLANAVQSNLAASIKRKLPLLNAFVTTFPEGSLDTLRSLAGVAYVEEDEIIRVNDVGSWGLDRVDQRNLPLDDSFNPSTGNGAGVTIYVIDTGIKPDHNDFGGRASTGAQYDFLDDGQNGIDCNGHGTHCAGTAAGTTYGVATGANVIGMRTLSCSGSGYKSDSIAALEWVTANAAKPSVVSMSLGGSYSLTQNTAVNNCKAAGFVVVVSAGNDNYNACNNSPASATGAITVGSTTSTDARSWFSNYGTCMNIFAPGSSITSLAISSNTATSVKSGTSMACPHVAGIAAIQAAVEDAKFGQYNVQNVYDTIISTATSDVVSDPQTGSPNLLAYIA